MRLLLHFRFEVIDILSKLFEDIIFVDGIVDLREINAVFLFEGERSLEWYLLCKIDVYVFDGSFGLYFAEIEIEAVGHFLLKGLYIMFDILNHLLLGI